MANFNEIVLRENERKLFISRISKNVKEEFIKFAKEEFCEDYGMCFKYLWDNFKLWKLLFENLDMKLDKIILMLENPELKSELREIKTLSGKKLKC